MSEKKVAVVKREYPKSIKALLLCAADLIEKKFAKNYYFKNGRYCAIGAIRHCAGYEVVSGSGDDDVATTKAVALANRACAQVVRYLPDYEKGNNDDITAFNDAESTTAKKVAALLRLAAEGRAKAKKPKKAA